MRHLKNLYIQVLLAVCLAIAFGIAFPENAQNMKILGDIFIKLIKMCIGPIIFCTIINGIVGGKSTSSVGRIGIKSLVYFEILTTFALIIGLIVALVIKPGSGMNIDPAAIDSAEISSYVKPQSNLAEFALNIIPSTIFKAFTEDNILSILFTPLFLASLYFR